MAIKDWAKKTADKIWDEAPRRAFWALLALLLASLSGFWTPFRKWLLDTLDVYRILPLAFGLAFAVLVICVWLLRRRIRALELKASTQSPVQAATEFEGIVASDIKLSIEWHILADPKHWLKNSVLDRQPAYADDVVQGPFHIKCKGAFDQYQLEEQEGKTSDGVCRHCNLWIFHWKTQSEVDEYGGRHEYERTLSEARLEVLNELKRLDRAGTQISGSLVLENPRYWEWIAPTPTP